MAMDVNVTNVDSANNVKVSLFANTTNTALASLIGGVRTFSENDPGIKTGTVAILSPETSNDYRLRTGMDTILFDDTFQATAQNTNLWSYTFNTLTAAQPGAGTLNFSAVQGTTSAHGAFMRTFQYFPLWGASGITAELDFGQFTAALVTDEVWLAGFGLPTAATTPPTDGCWFQLTSAGLIGVTYYSGVLTPTSTLLTIGDYTLGTIYKHIIVVNTDEVQFWRNDGTNGDVLLGTLPVPAGTGVAYQNQALPIFMMKYNTGAVSSTNTMRVYGVTVTTMDVLNSKPYGHQMAGMGKSAYVGQNGQTMGTTQAVGTVTSGSTPISPTSAAGSNTTANVTGLGGTGAINAAAGAATDFIATSFTNPASTINIPGKNLYITGVAISVINTGAAVATTPTTLLWSIGYGQTAVSLATTETASFATATTHAPRRIQLGYTSAVVGAAIGAPYDKELIRRFDGGPIVVRPGESIATIMKIVVGTATASQTITFNVTFDGYWE